jgi:xanthine dehydrogenase accessory factor
MLGRQLLTWQNGWVALWLSVMTADFCNPEPYRRPVLPVPMEELHQRLEITPWTYLVLTTRGLALDVAGLPSLLDSNAGYIGVIGSKRRWIMTTKKLIGAGIQDTKLEKVHSPIGLNIHAETPEEIAVSIMAEIILLRQ